ncbi:membrane protein [Lactiplantibacillus plantarum]|nr:membrane protein [Lactiplantibacillus plantarum]
MMMYPYLNLGPRDGVLIIAAAIMLALTVVFNWSVWELLFAVVAVVIAFLAGSMKTSSDLR